jgi:predicted ATPase
MNCTFCKGQYWSPIWILDKGIELKGVQKTREYYGDNCNKGIVNKFVEPCPVCHSQPKREYAFEFGKKINDKMINMDTLKEYIPENYNKAENIPIKSTLLIGPTGAGKTLILSYWYNRILYKQATLQFMYFTTERELFQELITRPEIIDRLKKMHYIFIDDMFEALNWRDQSGDSVTAKTQQMRIRELIDIFYRSQDKLIFASTNNRPDQVVDAPHIQRRIDEIFKNKVEIKWQD